MSQHLPTPPVPDIARAKGQTTGELVDWFVQFYNSHGAPFNYRSSTKAILKAYKGFHNLGALKAGCASERTAIGQESNIQVVNLAAPNAFGRATQVFELPRQKFAFGPDRKASYRVPFFFVEGGTVKLYFLQPRKHQAPDFDDLCMIATIYKRYLLDTEFFGQPCDLEFAQLCVPEGEKARDPKFYSLADLRLWSDRRLAERLTLISEALDAVAGSDRVEVRRRPWPRPEPEMPLFY